MDDVNEKQARPQHEFDEVLVRSLLRPKGQTGAHLSAAERERAGGGRRRGR